MNDQSVYSHRPLLFSLAYNILGEIQEAEDIVHDTFERWLSVHEDIRFPKAYLCRMVVNKAIDRLEILKKQRELYKGTWLPVPVLTHGPVSDPDKGKDLLPMALLNTLEKLNPVERAVFILREAFDFPYDEIAGMVGLTEENTRQVLHRASEKVRNQKSRYQTTTEKQQQLLQAFVDACIHKDTAALMRLLRDDVVLFTDGGGKASAALVTLHGPAKVAKFIAPILEKIHGTMVPESVWVNGEPGIRMVDVATGITDNVFTIETDGTEITGLYFVRNPDKIFL